jgi:hypothetical protein
MTNESRSAARESFAHQRARLLFANKATFPLRPRPSDPNIFVRETKSRHDIVRDGLIGFASSQRQ